MTKETSGNPAIPLIGLLAVKNHLLTRKDLQAAISQCRKTSDVTTDLKTYLLSNELVSKKNMDRLLRAAKAVKLRKKEYRFGTIAVKKGYINQSVLTLVLEEQQRFVRQKGQVLLIGDMLVEAGMLTEKQKNAILKLQKRMIEKTRADIGEDDHSISEQKTGTGSDQREKNKDSANKNLDNKDNPIEKMEPEPLVGGIQLSIASDFMAAFLSKTDFFDRNINVTQIKDALYDKGIIYGLVADEMIQGFIDSSGFKTREFRIAKGLRPVEGQDARIEFFFNADYLKAGGMTKDGTIDFKDRGEIPHVEAGTVLAEKIPMVESSNGQDIYGREILTTPGNDLQFKFGKGVKLSEDGFKAIAAVGGVPKYTLSGHIFVHDVYTTKGDVDYETGHVQYDGNVEVKGRVKSGFKVKCVDIKAIELDGGIIEADGDVTITGGVNEAKIYARGNVFAKFILASEIVCMGNVVVEKEIVDSDIENGGTCLAENGKIISSRVTSKMGIKAKNIGTEMSAPSQLRVGYDLFTEKELEQNRVLMDKVEKQIDQLAADREKLEIKAQELQKEITEMAHVQDRSQLEEKELHSQLAKMEACDPADKDDILQQIDRLKQNAKNAENRLDACFDEAEEIEKLLKQSESANERHEQRLEDFKAEKSNLIRWSNESSGAPVVIVDGSIMPETMIRGVHSEIRIPEVTRFSRVSEVRLSAGEGRSDLGVFEMQIGPL